jgi:hypothetical protein
LLVVVVIPNLIFPAVPDPHDDFCKEGTEQQAAATAVPEESRRALASH